ncbi:hypothetical protein RHGRI_031172 [Rhododendron griersonianum]|uniref:Uncharacterized protein n=1 Tax=Rhododendron griersonianum TaxID=479676 RepID=A0AAV6I6U8_9ERIC|nr:hypothetical protein RHGRI_031172 [Rhododendron griersonianum]
MSEGAKYERPSCELPRNYKISTGYDADRVVRGRRLSGGGCRQSPMVCGAAVVVAREEQIDREVEKRERRRRTAVERRDLPGVAVVPDNVVLRDPKKEQMMLPSESQCKTLLHMMKANIMNLKKPPFFVMPSLIFLRSLGMKNESRWHTKSLQKQSSRDI